MKYEPIKVYIIENGKYTDITYEELKKRREAEEEKENETQTIQEVNESLTAEKPYKDRYFIPIQGVLLEVSKKVYREHYKEYERNRYLKELDIANGLISTDFMIDEETAHPNKSKYTAKSIEYLSAINKLIECLYKLTDDERELVEAMFFQDMTEREYADKKGVYRNAIHKKKVRILKKLKKLMEN